MKGLDGCNTQVQKHLSWLFFKLCFVLTLALSTTTPVRDAGLQPSTQSRGLGFAARRPQ